MTEPDDDERARWIEAMAADMRAALSVPAIREELSGLLVGDPQDAKRRLRLGELREELDGFDLTWQRREGDGDGRD
jgi:hypothetical protein